jgi:hypothetical protein
VLVTVPDAELPILRQQASSLGVERPVVEGHLRLDGARCAFLDPEDRCGIHARFGLEAKPAVCQQYPLVVLETEAGRRAGIDPGCFHAHGDRGAWPVLDPSGVPARSVHFDSEQAHSEGALLAALGAPGATLGSVLGLLAGDRGHGSDLPPGLGARWICCLRDAGLQRFLNPAIAGRALRSALGPAFDLVPELDPDVPPAWLGSEPAADQLVREAVQRLVYLRVCSSQLDLVQGVALLGLLGGVLLAWCDPRPAALGPGMAGWCRLLRGPHFWRALAPDLQQLMWLAGAGRG